METAPGSRLDAALTAHRPEEMRWRDYTLALFDVGALLCRRRSAACDRCPLAPGCASRAAAGRRAWSRRPRKQAPYPGSMRELRGAVLRAMLDRPEQSVAALERAVAGVPAAARPGAVAEALAGLRRDGLLG